jgi:hypothetical protein
MSVQEFDSLLEFARYCIVNADRIYLRIAHNNVALCDLPLTEQREWIQKWWDERQKEGGQ